MSPWSRSMWVAVACVCALASCSEHAAPQGDEGEGPSAPARVTCTPARAGTVTDRVSFRGVVSVPPDRDAMVAPLVAGRIVEVAVREGDHVRRGDLVARTEDPTLAAGVVSARAGVASAQASADAARSALARAERLLADGIVARRDVEEARARALAADAELAAARGTSGLAAAQRGRARVTAPIDGVVVHVFRRVGELADGTPATPVVEIADLSGLELVGDVAAADLLRLAPEAVADVTVDALPSEHFAGRVSAIAPAVDPATSRGMIRVSLDDGSRLRIGMAGAVAITAGQPRAAVLVPADAVRRAAEGHDEIVVCEGAGARARARVLPVDLGARAGADVEIVRGVRAATPVVTSHVLGLDDGAELVVTRVATAAP